MKNAIIILLITISAICNAQKYTYETDGKILENGLHIAKFEKTSETITIIVNVDEDELINIEQATDEELHINYNIITFSDANNSVAYLRQQKKDVNLVDLVLRAKVIKGGVLQEEVIKQFCAKNIFDGLQNKAFVKKQKEEIKADKLDVKKELDEDKEFEKDEKLVIKETKKENSKEAKQEKKELAEEKRLEKKEMTLENKNQKKEIAEPNNKVKGEVIKESEVLLVLDKGMIVYGKKNIGKYAVVEGLIKGKKGETVTVYNKENKRTAMVKQQYDAQEAFITDTKTNTTTKFELYGNTKENKMVEIIFKLLELKML